jgi:hypothetical protein
MQPFLARFNEMSDFAGEQVTVLDVDAATGSAVVVWSDSSIGVVEIKDQLTAVGKGSDWPMLVVDFATARS